MSHIHIGPMARFWTAHYNRYPDAKIWDWVNAYSAPTPGCLGDRHNAIGKFERWHKLNDMKVGERRKKAKYLHWKFNPKNHPWQKKLKESS